METTIKKIEDMSLNAWPSHKMELYDGWILRFSYFYTHRTNSVEPVSYTHLQRPGLDLSVFKSTYFCDFQQLSAFIPHTPEMYQNVYPGSDLPSDCFQGKIDPHQCHRFNSRKHILTAVCMKC